MEINIDGETAAVPTPPVHVVSPDQEQRVRSLSKEPTTPSAARGFLDSARGFLFETFARRRKVERQVSFEEGTASVRWPGSEDLVWNGGLASASTGYSLECSPAQQMALEVGQGGALGTTGVDAADGAGLATRLLGGGTRPVHGAARQLLWGRHQRPWFIAARQVAPALLRDVSGRARAGCRWCFASSSSRPFPSY